MTPLLSHNIFLMNKGRNKPTFAATNSLRKHNPLAWQADITRSLQVFWLALMDEENPTHS